MNFSKDTISKMGVITVLSIFQAYTAFNYRENAILFLDKLDFEKPIVLISQLIVFGIMLLFTMRYLIAIFSNEGLNRYVRVKSIHWLLLSFYKTTVLVVAGMLLLQLLVYISSYHLMTGLPIKSIIENYSVTDYINYYLTILVYVAIMNLSYYLFKSMTPYIVIVSLVLIESFRVLVVKSSFSLIPLWTVEIHSIIYAILVQVGVYFIAFYATKRGDVLDANRS